VSPRATARSDRGQATVELALCLPVVAIVLLAVLQVAAIARDHVLVAHAAREAARAVAVGADQRTAAAVAARSSGLDPRRLDVGVSGSGPAGSRRVVAVEYRASTAMPVIGAVVGDVRLAADVTIRAE
jgi:Flp pilus assembly protein TadG